MSKSDTARLDAAAGAICERRNAPDWPCSGLDFDAEMARVALEAADAVDPMRVPTKELQGKVPLVLYFATRQDADEFAAVVKDAFTNPVEIVL